MKVSVLVQTVIEVEIDDKFQALDVPTEKHPDMSDEFCRKCLVAAQMAVNEIDAGAEVINVCSMNCNTMAEW